MATLTDLARRAGTWHRPMMLFAGVMAVMAVVSAGGLIFDDRILLGAPIWLKPFKFAVSMAVYCVTWAWMRSLLKKRRLADATSTVVVAILAVEYVIIVAQAVRGRASHFNVATPFDTTLWAIMGVSIAVLWTGTLVLTVLVLRARVQDAASRWAIRLGAVLSMVGLSLGLLMTSPSATQMASAERGETLSVIGAHSVGVEDGGPGMPITGWSTTGGDLRIPHFVGMHALQALPLFVMLLGVLASRFARLRSDTVRARLVLVAAGGYAGLIALVTWQALRGQPLIDPDRLTLTALAILVTIMIICTLLAVFREGNLHHARLGEGGLHRNSEEVTAR